MRLLLACVIALGVSGATRAEVRLSVGDWDYDLSGEVVTDGRARDFERDLRARPRAGGILELDWQRAQGPDLALAYAEFGARGRTRAGGALGFGPIPLGNSTTVLDTFADFRELEFGARWPLSRDVWRFAPGLVLKRLDGEVRLVESGAEVARDEVDLWFPQGLARLDWQPSRALRLGLSVQGIEYDGDRAHEWQASADIRLGLIALSAGWQEKRYDLQDGDDRIKARLRGPQLQAGFGF